MAGLAAIGVGVFIATFFGRNPDVDERHAVFLFASAWMLFGAGFVRIGVLGVLAERRARARASGAVEPWLRDRAWQRDGTRPVGAERILPNLAALVAWVAYLVPFHTIWRLPLSWWGAWIVLGLFDLLAVAILVTTAGRLWAGLRSGRCFLRWSSAPIAPGERFSARFESSRTIAASGQVIAKLRCLRDSSGGARNAEEAAPDADEIWAESRSFPVYARPEGGTWAEIAFEVPADARGTTSAAARPVRWTLVVTVPTAGPDFTTTFPVPVYARGA